MYDFLSGAVSALSLVAATFFYFIHKKIADRFFLYFAAAFLVFSLERILISLQFVNSELSALVYLLRLSGFALILVAIVEKNVKVDPCDED